MWYSSRRRHDKGSISLSFSHPIISLRFLVVSTPPSPSKKSCGGGFLVGV